MADNLRNAAYDALQASSTYLTLPGVYGMPTGGPDGSPPAMVKCHATYQLRVVSWAATRTGAPPACPPAEDLDANNLLVAAQITGLHPLPVAPAGKHAYVMTGVYTFVVQRPLGPRDELPLGRLPIDKMGAAEGNFPAQGWDPTQVARSGGLRVP